MGVLNSVLNIVLNRKWRGAVLASVAVAVVLTGCGSRLSHERLLADATRGTSSGSSNGGSSGGSSGVAAGSDATTGSDAGVGADSGGTGSDLATGGIASAGVDSGGTAAGGQLTKSEIVLLNIGNYSGITGSVYSPAQLGVRLWASWINDNGGLNGHPVRLLVDDDQSDPARHKAQVQQAVEKDHAMALVGEYTPQTTGASVDYLNQKRIPVFGGNTNSPEFESSIVHFSPTGIGDFATLSRAGGVADVAIPQGKTKVAVLVCAEASSCASVADSWQRVTPKVGLQVVYRATSSVAQPDFTAECLSAQGAGAQIIMANFDQNSIRRIGASCTRQGYHPVFWAYDPSFLDDPSFEGGAVTTDEAPWFAPDNPALAQLEGAIKRYAPNTALGPLLVDGWVSGKMLERAASALPDQPTSEDFFNGIYGFDGDTLGGLTQPLSFTRDQVTPHRGCGFVGILQNKAVQIINGGEIKCWDG